MSELMIELEAHDGAGVVTLGFASRTFASRPSDPRPNFVYEGRLQDAGQFQRSVFGSAGEAGSSQVSYGFVTLNNGDHGLDRLKDYAVDGRPIWFYQGDPSKGLVGRKLLFRGAMKGVQTSNALETLDILIKDRQAELDEPLLTQTYAGTTLTADKTVEGNADLKGQLKPGAWGVNRQTTPRLVNAQDYLWQACANPARSLQLYDGCVPLTNAGDYPSIAALMAATLPEGSYGTCLSLGIFRPQNMMELAFTIDVVDAAINSTARVVQRMLYHFGLTPADLDLDSFDRLHAFNPADVGIFVDSGQTALAAIQQVLDSIYASIVTRLDGRFRVVALAEPVEEEAIATFTFREIATEGSDIQLNVSPISDVGPIPPWKAFLDYGRLWRTFQKTELASRFWEDAAKVLYHETEIRRVEASRQTVKDRHPLSKPITFTTLLIIEAAAQAEVARRLALFAVQRDRPSFTVVAEDAAAVEIGDTVIVETPFFGWDAGKPFRVLGIGDDFEGHTRTLELWG